MNEAIVAVQLEKRFGEKKALDGLELSIPKGMVYSLLGPNGAGKTTAIRVLTTLLKPSSGSAFVLGLDVAKEAANVRTKVSLTGQYASVDEELTGHENLVLISRLYGMSWNDAKKRATSLLEEFHLTEAAHHQVRTFSGGMRRRIDIATSLVTRPEILFLDEPTTGLDPRSRNQVWDLVRQVAADGTTVLLTTQYLEEADRLASRMAVIDHGKVIAEGTSHELKSSVGTNTLRLQVADQEAQKRARVVLRDVLNHPNISLTDGAVLSVNVTNSAMATNVLSALAQANIVLTDFSLGAPSLDDVFFALTGRPPQPVRSTETDGGAP
jgi:ABC-2 type transport system ATP-binding protein